MEKERTILIVGDNQEKRQIIQKQIENEFAVYQTADEKLAWEILASRQIDVAIVALTVLSQADFAWEHRFRKEYPSTPLLAWNDCDDMELLEQALMLGATEVLPEELQTTLVKFRIRSVVQRLTEREQSEILQNRRMAAQAENLAKTLREVSEVTGIYSKDAFYDRTREALDANPEEQYVIARFDIDRFKVYNDVFGTTEGDRLLRLLGDKMREHSDRFITYGYLGNDHFVVCMRKQEFVAEDEIEKIERTLSARRKNFNFVVRVGVYEVDDPTLSIGIMCDRAYIALRTIKGDYRNKVARYTVEMRQELVKEQQITSEMWNALEEGQFVPYFQPQYDYGTKRLCGAEALVRWIHPERGLISPGDFIPIFEKNGFISDLDYYMWESVCRLLRKWMNLGYLVVPVSVNVSRKEISPSLCDRLMGLIEKYNLEPQLLRLEITETAYMDDAGTLITVVNGLQEKGFFVEMDDFGSGYSSLNTLKNVPVDLLKLDMKFLENINDNVRSGSILSSVIRMSRWLSLPIMAEGIEERNQAEYLKSMGCFLMQGYYFAKPMPAEKYEEMLRSKQTEYKPIVKEQRRSSDAIDFLDATSRSTTIFNSFVGGGMILEQRGEVIDILRVNDKLYELLGITKEVFEQERMNLLDRMTEEGRKEFFDTLRNAYETHDESECVVVMKNIPHRNMFMWLRARVKYLEGSEQEHVFYVAVENINEQKSNEYRNLLQCMLIDSLPYGIMQYEVRAGKLQILGCNDYMWKCLRYPSKEAFEDSLNAKNSLLNVNPEDKNMLCETVNDLLEQGGKKYVTYRIRSGGGEYLRIHTLLIGKDIGNEAMLISAVFADGDWGTRLKEAVNL